MTAPQPEQPSKAYQPAAAEPRITAKWAASKAFHADPSKVLSGQKKPYCILIPPPNVTGALHLGHALNNTLQDVLTRSHRMMGYETLWMPGTDHAGIATQAVVERRLKKEQNKSRKDFSRDDFIAQVQAWKDEYEQRITGQLKAMGCSCDFDRQRFTMDPICARAVREAFFRLFRDGLIYRGKRLVNWDPALQTAVADDECYDEETDAHFYFMKYPIVGSDETITVATTRPETYLGDTGVAMNPKDPRAAVLVGKKVRLPLLGREIPIIADPYAVLPESMATTDEEKNDPKAKFSTGFVKMTPAHDFNDYEIGVRHNLAMINMMSPDGRVSDQHGWTDGKGTESAMFVGLTMAEARKKVVAEFKQRGLLEDVKPYRQSITFSDRSKAVIEPYLSDQWYVRVTDDRLAGAANRALVPDQRSDRTNAATDQSIDRNNRTDTNRDQANAPGVRANGPIARTSDPSAQVIGANVRSNERSGASRNAETACGDGSMRFYPARYAKTYEHWHDNIRDWCISRQLWWGHRIPVWTYVWDGVEITLGDGVDEDGTPNFNENLTEADENAVNVVRVLKKRFPGELCNSQSYPSVRPEVFELPPSEVPSDAFDVVLRSENPAIQAELEKVGFVHDPDVLDTWFSSALWPLSTMGWPDPGQSSQTKDLLAAGFNPTTVLSTAREIITLWVSRMVMMNRYFTGDGDGRGDIPFHDVFIHAVVQDGEGKKMSKTAGNGVDPLDIIESHGADAMRFTLAQMTTNTQDVRMPVRPDPKTGKNTSEKFDAGRNFCNKLWNASRFAMAILERNKDSTSSPGDSGTAGAHPSSLIDRWMLSRLARAVRACESSLASYEFADYCQTLYQLLWWDFCDWYLEAIKPTVDKDAGQRAVLRTALDVIIRLLHPVAPFITEAIHEQLRAHPETAVHGVTLSSTDLLCTSSWPALDAALIDEAAEQQFEALRELINAIRNVRSEHQVLPKRKISLHGSDATAKRIAAAAPGLVENLAGLEAIAVAKPDSGIPTVAFRAGGEELFLSNLADAKTGVDAAAEKDRLSKQLDQLRKSEGALNGRLSNPGYVDKAPPKLVEESKQQLAKIRAEIAALEGKLREL